MKTSLPHRFRTASPAFTLTEIALSVGIASVCLMSLLALLPHGLETLRTSANRQAEARMTQTVVSYYQMTPWIKQQASGERSEILEDKTFFFDQTGTQLPMQSHVDRLYVVRATLEPDIPILAGDAEENRYLRRLRLRFTDRQNFDAAFVDGSGQYVDRPAWIVNIEQTGPFELLSDGKEK